MEKCCRSSLNDAAAGIAFDLAFRASDTPEGPRKWYRTAEIMYKAKDYGASARLVEWRIKARDNPQNVVADLKKLQAMNYFFLAQHEEVFKIMEELKAEGVLSKEEISRFACLRAYHLFTRRQYAHAANGLHRVLQEEKLEGYAKEMVDNVLEFLAEMKAGTDD